MLYQAVLGSGDKRCLRHKTVQVLKASPASALPLGKNATMFPENLVARPVK